MEARDGKHSFTLGIKRYADLTHNEWHRIQFQANYVPTTSGSKYFFENARNDMNLSMPKCIDWRTMVTFVLNQFLSTNLYMKSCYGYSLDITTSHVTLGLRYARKRSGSMWIMLGPCCHRSFRRNVVPVNW